MIPSSDEMNKALEARIGAELLERFSKSEVAVCGLGGLGSNISISLARSGIGTLHLIDFDKVDISNLNRQQYKVSQLGMFKTDAMKENLHEIAPYCNIKTDTLKLDESNFSILKNADVICEAFDNPEFKSMIVNWILENMPEKYIVSASGMSGLHSGNTVRTRKIIEKLYICGDGESDVEKDRTLFAPRVMLCASHQANTVLRIIAEKFEV